MRVLPLNVNARHGCNVTFPRFRVVAAGCTRPAQPRFSNLFQVWLACAALVALSLNLYAQDKEAAVAQRKRTQASTTFLHGPELQSRLTALDSAKESNDPAAVSDAARRVIALTLRLMGEVQLRQGSFSHAAENSKRSLDFEESTSARRDLVVSYLAGNQFDDALSAVTDLLTSDPENAQGWYLQGRVWMAKHLYKRAVESFTRSADLKPNPDTLQWLRDAQLKAKQPDTSKLAGAREFTEDRWTFAASGNLTSGSGASKAVRNNPQELKKQQADLRRILASALNDLGTAEARQQQFATALAHFREAEKWQPETAGLQRNLGMGAMRASDYSQAVRALRPALAANPQDRVARASLGSALFATNAFAEAADTLSPLGDSALEHPEVAYAWAASLIKINKYPQAVALLTRLEAAQISPPMLLLIAQAWSQMGTYPRTVQACHRALEAEPKLLTAHYLAGLALIRQDRPIDAAQEFRAELQLDPDNTEAQYNLAFVLLQQSQDAEAVDLLKKVLARNPEHPEANYELGKQLISSGTATEAIVYLEAAARLKPAFEPVHYQLQAAYRAAGRKEDADREAKIYRELKAKSRNITLPPPREQSVASPQNH